MPLLSLQNRKCLRHRLLSRTTTHLALAGEMLRNRQGESQFPQTEAKSHDFRYFFRFDRGEFLWKTVGAFVERRMIRLTNQSKIERNFTFPGYAGGSPKAKFRSGGTSPVGSGTQTLVDRPRWPDWGCTEHSRDSDSLLCLPDCSKSQDQTEANDMRRHAEANARNSGRSPVLHGLQPDRHAVGCLCGRFVMGNALEPGAIPSRRNATRERRQPPFTVYS